MNTFKIETTNTTDIIINGTIYTPYPQEKNSTNNFIVFKGQKYYRYGRVIKSYQK